MTDNLLPQQRFFFGRLPFGAAGLGLSMAIAYGLPVGAQIPTTNVTSFEAQTPAIPSVATPKPPTDAIHQENAYTLGANDQIRIDIFNVPELSGNNGSYIVLADGSLNLPWIGSVSVQGVTLEEAAAVLTQKYAQFIREPLITVSLITPRPLRIGIVGAVNRPGAYTTGQSAGSGPAGEITGNTAGQLRTVTQAIQTAGGITQLADIRQIQVRRPRINGSEELIDVDLWNFLQTGDLRQDITLRDGDTVVIPIASELNPTEAPEIAAASFSPGTINVNVVGQVVSPGVVAVQPNITLNQAILAAGGFDDRRARRADVELVRLNPNGTVSRRTIPVDFSDGLNEETNPALRSNDIVIVSRSGLARTSDFLDTLLSPITGVLGLLSIFGL
jgi:polysaccharide biosynthesis/export protein